MENIIRRLAEEQKFNRIQSEPSGEIGESQNMMDSETRALIGNTDDSKLMHDYKKRRLVMETTRERVESKLSFRHP